MKRNDYEMIFNFAVMGVFVLLLLLIRLALFVVPVYIAALIIKRVLGL